MPISLFFSPIILFSAWLTTVVALPYVKRVGLSFGVIDKPNKRKQHKKPIVRIGGLAMIIGLFISWLLYGVLASSSQIDALKTF